MGIDKLRLRADSQSVSATPDPSILRHPPFGLFLSARACTGFAYQMQSVAIGWQVYALTNSAFALGIVGLVQFMPVLLLTLAAGHVADRYDRRRVAQCCQIVEGCAGLTLATGTVSGLLSMTGIYVIVGVIGCARAFESPALSALMPGLVCKEQLQRANAWSASANQTASIMGPAFGGLFYELSPPVAFMVAGVLFLVASLLVALVRVDFSMVRGGSATLKSVFSGVVFIRSNPAILGSISLDLFAVLLGGATALLPIFARDILHTGPWGLGMLRAAPAIGALAMSVVLARHPIRRRSGETMLAAVAIYGLATVVFALSDSLVISLIGLCALGAADVVSVVIRSALVQMRTPDAMRGRVSAVNNLFIGTSNELGEFESGMTAALFGAVPATLMGGVGTVAIAFLWFKLFPTLRAIDRPD